MDDHKEAKAFRDWAGLGNDILLQIFDKVWTESLFKSVLLVCHQWRKLAYEPRIWKQVHLKESKSDETSIISPNCNLLNIGLAAVDRSAGCLQELFIERGSTEYSTSRSKEWSLLLLQHIARRYQWDVLNVYTTTKRIKSAPFVFHQSISSPQLKRLKLGFCHDVTNKDLIEACKSFPLLKLLHLLYCTSLTEPGVVEACKSCSSLEVLCVLNYTCRLNEDEIKSVGQACPNLKVFSFIGQIDFYCFQSDNSVALAIAKNMPGLQKLHINYCDLLDDDGLVAILDGCLHLEFVYVPWCQHLMLGEKLKCRVDRVKVKYYNGLKNKYVDCDDFYVFLKSHNGLDNKNRVEYLNCLYYDPFCNCSFLT